MSELSKSGTGTTTGSAFSKFMTVCSCLFGCCSRQRSKSSGWHGPAHDPRSTYDGMAGGAQRDHERQVRNARYPVMHHDRAFSASGSSAYPAAIPVSSEHLFPQTAKIFLILPLERVARGTHAQCENFSPSATAVECPLNSCPNLLHFPLPFPLKKSFSLLGRSRTIPGRRPLQTQASLTCVDVTSSIGSVQPPFPIPSRVTLPPLLYICKAFAG